MEANRPGCSWLGQQYWKIQHGVSEEHALPSAARIEKVFLGFPYCYGVFREYFFTHGPCKGVEYVSVAGVAANVGFPLG